jgi:phosphoribosyl 1,2-cyclic phosphodiesterase
LITHEHNDHIKGVKTLTKKHKIKSWLTFDTYMKIRSKTGPIDTEFVEVTEAFSIGEVEVIPYEVFHDAVNPVAYVLTKGELRIGVLLDCGKTTPYLIDGFSKLDVLIIEANHSFDRILESNYPNYLKERILSTKGHLSNWHVGDFLIRTQPKLVIFTHLSEMNNSPEAVLSEVEEVYSFQRDIHFPFLVFTPTDGRSSVICSEK